MSERDKSKIIALERMFRPWVERITETIAPGPMGSLFDKTIYISTLDLTKIQFQTLCFNSTEKSLWKILI